MSKISILLRLGKKKLRMPEISAACGAIWQAMTKEEKAPYCREGDSENISGKDCLEYIYELISYMSTLQLENTSLTVCGYMSGNIINKGFGPVYQASNKENSLAKGLTNAPSRSSQGNLAKHY